MYFSKFGKQCKTFREIKFNEDQDDIADSKDKDDGKSCNEDEMQHQRGSLKFAETHPGHEFSHLRRRKFEVIPVVNIQKGSLCSIRA